MRAGSASTLDRSVRPGAGATLEQYAWTRIHGAVLDELVAMTGRRVRCVAGSATSDAHVSATSPSTVTRPTRDELAEAVGLTTGELDKWLDDIGRSDVGSLNVLVLGDDQHNDRADRHDREPG